MTKRSIIIGLAALLLSAGPAMAAPTMPIKLAPQTQAEIVTSPRYMQYAENKISASQAKSIARSRVPGGEVVDISLENNTYRVRVIARDGRLVDIFVDASTGRVK